VVEKRRADRMHGHFEHLLIYGYGEWLTDHGGLSTCKKVPKF
jgi:hypothetical protein